MLPTIRPGERVRVARGAHARVGDVVLYQGDEALVLHRVLWRPAGIPWFVHRGDAVGARPGVAPVSRILGRADTPRVLVPRRSRYAILKRLPAVIARRIARLRRGR